MMSSSVTIPSVPPNSSTTIAICTFSFCSIRSTVEIFIDGETQTLLWIMLLIDLPPSCKSA